MIDPSFDPYEMLLRLQQQIDNLHEQQRHMFAIMNQNRDVVIALHNSNKKNFELMMDQQQRIDNAIRLLEEERAKKQS